MINIFQNGAASSVACFSSFFGSLLSFFYFFFRLEWNCTLGVALFFFFFFFSNFTQEMKPTVFNDLLPGNPHAISAFYIYFLCLSDLISRFDYK